MAVQEIDELKIYRGTDYPITDDIIIHIPTLDEICDYGDNEYFGLIKTLTSTPSDMMWQLDELGVDFTEIDNFTLFSQLLCAKPDLTDKTEEEIKEVENNFLLNINKTKIVLGNLNLFDFMLMENPENHEPCLFNPKTGVIIDAYTYKLIADCLRKIHFMKENIEIPANNSTKLVLIEDAKERYLMNKDKTPSSYLLNLISAMVNVEGFKYNHKEVWSMKINAFMDSVRRVAKIKNANLLLQSGYSGFGINLKEISDKQIDWLGDLE